MISAIAKQRLTDSITSLVERLSESTRFSRAEAEAVVRDYILGIMSTDSDTVSAILPHDKLTTIKHSYVLAQRAIASWVDSAPESLNTLAEIAAALKNDSGIVDEILQRIATVEQDSLDLLSALNDFRGKFNTNFVGHRLLSPYISQLLEVPAGTYVGKATTTMLGIDQSAKDGILQVSVVDVQTGVKMISYQFHYSAGVATRTCATNSPDTGDSTKVKYIGWFCPEENIGAIYESLTAIFNEARLELN